MTLAARCPACGTVFRVVQDQLRVSEGWVRCGRCAEVFNAIETLVDLDTEADRAVAAAKPERERNRVLEALARVSRPAPLGADDRRSPAAPRPAPEAAVPSGADIDLPLPGDTAPPHAGIEDGQNVAVARLIGMPSAPGEGFGVAPAELPPAEAAPRPADRPATSVAAPEFVRRADRAARWRRPGVRLALSLTAAVAGLALALQVLMVYRDLAAARWPALQPLLANLCAGMGCTLEPPRLIDALVVESSGLVRTEGGSAYRLQVVLRNRADIALALPALDLTLTDAQGNVIARRVVTLAELGSHLARIGPGAELTLQGLLTAGERLISGYTIEIFYP